MFQQFSPNARNIYKLHQIALLFGGGAKKKLQKIRQVKRELSTSWGPLQAYGPSWAAS